MRVTLGSTEIILTETPQIVTPVTWLVAPELLTIDEALHLSGLTRADAASGR